ncbi:PREDICTED: probable ATP-dependent RNA helicase DDX4 [Priapulus caudatus]|uniref:RNA helicase n=1 Tax=Priapulus caudatus TaxID=37621 RepID=A0ABM1E7A3_PRICU|nr:PREDICTED: probable ATP-dependent RNA helicase DDX4 [Priapulus caudatus]
MFGNYIHAGINFAKYDNIPHSVTGDSPPKEISSFEEAGLGETFLQNVRRAHYVKPTPIQKLAIPAVNAGRDVMACAQTGSGKTAAFLLPVLKGIVATGLEGSSIPGAQQPYAVVVAPTRELAVQIQEEARKFSYNTVVKCVVAYGGVSVMYQLKNLDRGCHILVATPGRLMDFVGRGKVSLAKCCYLILDEADRMLDMGFLPEIRKLVTTFDMPDKSERQTMMFSATFPNEIQNLAAEFMNNYLFIVIGIVGGANSDVEQTIFQVEKGEKQDKLNELLNASGNDRTLVFVERKRMADFVCTWLCQNDHPATSIHGDREQAQREEALRDFRYGKARVLVATQVAARGLDIPDVKHVINYDLPKEIDEYVHRIGRTGRVGNVGRASSFYDSSDDAHLAGDLVKILSDAQQMVPDWLQEAASHGGGGGGGGYRGGGGGTFGGRDVRRGQYGSNSGNDYESSSAPFGSTAAAVSVAEVWD